MSRWGDDDKVSYGTRSLLMNHAFLVLMVRVVCIFYFTEAQITQLLDKDMSIMDAVN